MSARDSIPIDDNESDGLDGETEALVDMGSVKNTTQGSPFGNQADTSGGDFQKCC